MYKVWVTQNKGANMIRFAFNELAHAMEFISTCIEVGDKGTEACIREINEEEDE